MRRYLLIFSILEVLVTQKLQVPLNLNFIVLDGIFEQNHVSLKKCSSLYSIESLIFLADAAFLAEVDIELFWLLKTKILEIFAHELPSFDNVWVTLLEIVAKFFKIV